MKLTARVDATQQTIDKFLDQPFAYGSADCVQLAAFHCAAAGIEIPAFKVQKYRSEATAIRALKAIGFESLEALLDSLFEPIPPASAIVGDIIGLPGGTDAHQWTALGIHVGASKIIAFADCEDGRGPVCQAGPVSVITHAWRLG